MHFELLLRVPLWWLHCFISSIGRGWDDNLKSSTIFPSCLRFGGHTAAAAAKSLQSCPTLCDRIDSSPPGSPIPGILQARTQEWVAISFSNAWKWKVKVKPLSRVRLLATHGLQPSRPLRSWDFPGKSTGVGCHCLEDTNHGQISCGLECGKLGTLARAPLPSCAHELHRGETQWVLTSHAGLLAVLDWGIGFTNPRNSINWLNVLFHLLVYLFIIYILYFHLSILSLWYYVSSCTREWFDIFNTTR